MNRPALEVADIFRTWAGRFIERSRARISWPQHKVMRAIERCRTAALGRHRDRCSGCGKDFGFSFNSCRNRHCPKCQAQARNHWVAARIRELVPLNYFHSRVHRAAPALRTHAAKQAHALRPAVPLRGRHAAGGRGQPEAPGRRDRFSVRTAHVGTDARSSPAHPLRRAGRGIRPRPHPLDQAQVGRLLSAPGSAQRGLPGKVHRGPEKAFSAARSSHFTDPWRGWRSRARLRASCIRSTTTSGSCM